MIRAFISFWFWNGLKFYVLAQKSLFSFWKKICLNEFSMRSKDTFRYKKIVYLKIVWIRFNFKYFINKNHTLSCKNKLLHRLLIFFIRENVYCEGFELWKTFKRYPLAFILRFIFLEIEIAVNYILVATKGFKCNQKQFPLTT